MDPLQQPPSSPPSSPTLSSPPSSPLSVLSKSPSLPSSPTVMDVSKRYPSPSSSAIPSGSASPIKSCDASDATDEIRVRTDGTDTPPRKRRRIVAPLAPRTTSYIDLEAGSEEEDAQLERLLVALRRKKRIVVIAGAGISVSAGIPDFRSSTGLFASLRGQHKLKGSGKHLFDASVYKHDDSTESFHTMVRELASKASKASPTPFHHMLASLAKEGRLMRLYTQNIDGIDTKMEPLKTQVPLSPKGPWPITIQLHGGLDTMVCTKCGHLEPFNASLFEGPEPPPCETCKQQDEVRTKFAAKRSHGIGKLRPRIVLYNEHNPEDEAIGMVAKADLRRVPDAVVVVGTSLKVPGARKMVKEMCQLTRSRRNGITAWINLDPEPQGVELKDCWDFVVKGKCDDIAELTGLPRWDALDIGDRESYMVTGDEMKEKKYAESVNRAKIGVLLERKRKRDEASASAQAVEQASAEPKAKLEDCQGEILLTPSASPKPRCPLPTARIPNKGKTKQSTLSFGSASTARSKELLPDTTARKSSGAQRKPRQSKKEIVKPKNRLDQQFKATKAVAPSGKQTPTKVLRLDLDLSDLSSPPSFAELPSLRPTTTFRTSLPMKIQHVDGTPPPVLKNLETISPTSKPRDMDHLID